MIRCNSFLSSHELVKCQLKPCFLLKNENTYCWKVKLMPIKLPGVEHRRVVGVLPPILIWKISFEKFSFETFPFEKSHLKKSHLKKFSFEKFSFETFPFEKSYLKKSHLKNSIWKNSHLKKFSFENSNLCSIHPCQIPRITYIKPTEVVKRRLICWDLQIFKQIINFQYLQILTLPPPDAPICAFDTPEVIF